MTRRSMATPAMPHQQPGRKTATSVREHSLATLLIGSVITAIAIFEAPAHEHDDLDCLSHCQDRLHADMDQK